MMGQLPFNQNALFYNFCLENCVPADQLLRHIDRILDLKALRQHLVIRKQHYRRGHWYKAELQ